MRASLVYTSILLYFLISIKNGQTGLENTESILCRSCGHDISSKEFIFSKSSPRSYESFTDALFGKDEVLVEIFFSEFFFTYPVITFHSSTCLGVGEWEEHSSWYPGYRWKPCVCPECGAYIGWVFEPIYPALVEPSELFYGFILSSLISETCKYYYFIRYQFLDQRTCIHKLTMATDVLSTEDKEFLARCEEELKDRYTEKDDDFMSVFSSEPCIPPVLDSWWSPNNSGRRNDRRNNRRYNPYERHERNNRDRNNYERRDRGYNDHRNYEDRSQRNRYY